MNTACVPPNPRGQQHHHHHHQQQQQQRTPKHTAVHRSRPPRNTAHATHNEDISPPPRSAAVLLWLRTVRCPPPKDFPHRITRYKNFRASGGDFVDRFCFIRGLAGTRMERGGGRHAQQRQRAGRQQGKERSFKNKIKERDVDRRARASSTSSTGGAGRATPKGKEEERKVECN